MKYLTALIVCAMAMSCSSTDMAGPSPFHAEISFSGNGDARWDPFERLFVGHVKGTAFVGGRDHFNGTPWAAVNLTDGKRRVINRGLDFDEEFELDQPIPSWCRILFPEAVFNAESGCWVAVLQGGQKVQILKEQAQ
jgi:hypothetical protein